MRDFSGLRGLRLPFRGPSPDEEGDPLRDFADVAQSVRAAYPVVEPSRAFRDALHARLLAEAAWLREHPLEDPREAAVKRSAVAAAALLLLGLAALAWRHHHAQPQAGR